MARFTTTATTIFRRRRKEERCEGPGVILASIWSVLSDIITLSHIPRLLQIIRLTPHHSCISTKQSSEKMQISRETYKCVEILREIYLVSVCKYFDERHNQMTVTSQSALVNWNN